MRRAARNGPLLAIATLAVAGCGTSGSDLPSDIPPANASALQRDLTRAQQACADGLPITLRNAADDYSTEVENLPSSVDAKVREVLRSGARNLAALARTQAGCSNGATGATGAANLQSTTSSETAAKPSKPKPSPKPTPKARPTTNPKPKPSPKPTTTTPPTTTESTSTTEPTTPSAPTTTGGGTPTTGGGSSGGVGVGPGKDARK